MLKVGLTGGIGSGKSIVAGIFISLGVPVYNADRAAKTIMNTDDGVRQGIIRHFGKEAFAGGELNRAYLASVVFSDNEKLHTLNELVHPATIQDAQKWFENQRGPYAIKEAALIFESNSQQYLDYVIGVTAPESVRIERVMKRDGISAEKVIDRMNQQMDEAEKIKRCDFVIDNSGSISVISQVLTLHIKLSGLAVLSRH
jgi:dephospho-CoA kinase